MRLMLSILLMFVLMPWHALGATPKPSTEPKEGEDTILDGAIIFTAPEGWQQLSHDQQTVQYTSPDRKGTIVVTARPQEVNINKSVADQIGMAIKKKIAEQVKASGAEFLISPRIEKDDLLFLKIHDRSKKGDAVADRLQLYQMVGLNLVTVISVASTDNEDEINAFQKVANDTILSARFQKLDTKTGKRVPVKPRPPTTLPKNYWKARLRILEPTGWTEQITDNTTGTVATFNDRQHADVKIRVDVEPLPAGIGPDDPRLAKLADEMLDRQQQAEKKSGREMQGEPEALDDPAFIRKSRWRYSAKPQPLVITSRVQQIGNTLVNVITEAPADESPRVEKLADKWATESITPIGLSPARQPEKEKPAATTRPIPGLGSPEH